MARTARLPVSRGKIDVYTRESNTHKKICNTYVRLCPTVACTVLMWYIFRGVRLSNTVD